MAIKIQTEKPVIPIEIGELKYEFPIDDANLKKIREDVPALEKKYANVSGKDDDENEELTKKMLREGFALLLGKETAFDEIYEQTPSTISCLTYYVEIAKGIQQNIDDRGLTEKPQEKVDKYIQNKKSNKQHFNQGKNKAKKKNNKK